MHQEQIKQLIIETGISECDLTDYEFVRSRLMARLNNPDNNMIRERNLVYRYYQDLPVSYHIVLDNNEDRMISVPVSKRFLEYWQVTENELYLDALNNIDRLHNPTIRTMSEMLLNLGVELDFNEMEGPPMYVVTNNCNNYGAVVVLSETLMNTASDLIGEDFWIIPSSVHEMILVPASMDQTREEIEDMVRTINETQVSPEEVLGNRVYYYDIVNKKIS